MPAALTLDRDVRWVGSATQRDFPSALIQFLLCLGVQPNVLPPHHPELNCYVERYHRTYAKECVEIFRPATLEEAKTVTELFRHHYNHERPVRFVSPKLAGKPEDGLERKISFHN